MLPLFESNSILDGGSDYDVNSLMEYYWKRKVHRCKYCQKLLSVTRSFNSKNPMIIVVSLNLMNTLINPFIIFQGSEYEIFAVAYTNGGHYIARIRRHDGVYEYDGNYSHGRLLKVERSNPLSEKIITMSGWQYKAQMVWYKNINRL